jgi:hypothetical protein
MRITVFGGPPSDGGDPGWVPGTTYVFDPPVQADGIPKHQPRLCEVQPLRFNRGLYLGYTKGNHVFMGTPILDPRGLPQDKRECFFYVTPNFVGSRMSVETPPEPPRKRPPWVDEVLRHEK